MLIDAFDQRAIKVEQYGRFSSLHVLVADPDWDPVMDEQD